MSPMTEASTQATDTADEVPWVWIHGYLGSQEIWRTLRPGIHARQRVLTLDLPGFGSRVDESAPCRIADFASDVLDTLSAQGITTFALMGHSMGGQIAQEVALMSPQRVQRLVLYGTGPVGAMPGRFETIERSRERLRDEGVAATARRIAATWFTRREAAPDWAWVSQLARSVSLRSADHCLQAMGDWHREGELAKIACPTQIIWGEHDQSYAWTEQMKLWKNIPDAAMAVIPRAAHAAHLDQPTIFAALIADFMAGSNPAKARSS